MYFFFFFQLFLYSSEHKNRINVADPHNFKRMWSFFCIFNLLPNIFLDIWNSMFEIYIASKILIFHLVKVTKEGKSDAIVLVGKGYTWKWNEKMFQSYTVYKQIIKTIDYHPSPFVCAHVFLKSLQLYFSFFKTNISEYKLEAMCLSAF